MPGETDVVESGGLFQGLFAFVTQAAKQFAESRAKGREDDRYVVGGTHWDGFSHKSLFKMVWENADPVNVERLADTWTRQGDSIANRSEELQRSLDKLMQYWSGAAAEEATSTVRRNVDWLAELGGTASRMAGPIDHAAGALRSAQQQMPAPPEGFSWSSLGGGAAAGFAVGGPIGAGIGAMIGGIGSMFGGASKKRKLKKRAVQTMERFENAAIDVDGTTPAFGGPATGGAGGDGSLPPGSGGGGVGTLPPDQRPLPGSGGTTPPGGLPDPTDGRGVTVPSFVGGGQDPRWSALTGGPGSGGLGGGFGSGSGAGAGGFGAGAGKGGLGFGPFGGPGGLLGALPPGRGGGVGAGARDMLRAGNRFGAAGRFGAGGGAGMAGGPMAGRGANGDDDREYDRRFPLEEDLFSSDQKAAPPVIGL
ncbi:PPE family protein [Umezawaea tangerina]|uniref:PPE family protein n=1 Tax=Umezawaea tangerina TaxID=84725 RepID=A0A2T0TMG1_9PSEU|nr:PPE family protein [Umezawaea tangerina]